ncbi:MAG: type II toxin-antitoxin system Phd/YefM family antitoxin [Acidiphilium sp.]
MNGETTFLCQSVGRYPPHDALPRGKILVKIIDQNEDWNEMAMITVGAFEAKTYLSTLLDRAAAGEEVVITKHGRPVARLVGAQQIDRARVNEAFERLKALRKGTMLGGLSWTELRDEGRP